MIDADDGKRFGLGGYFDIDNGSDKGSADRVNGDWVVGVGRVGGNVCDDG